MHDDNTHHLPIEKTFAVPEVAPIAPPPPPESLLPQPKRPKRKALTIGIAAVIFLVLLISITSYFVTQNSFSLRTTQKAPSPIPSPTINPNYTASDIANDYQAHNLPVTNPQENESIYAWTGDTYATSVPAASSVVFTNASACTAACSPEDLGIWVYASKADTLQAAKDVHTDEATDGSLPMMGIPRIVVAGRCLLLDTGTNTAYDQVTQENCV